MPVLNNLRLLDVFIFIIKFLSTDIDECDLNLDSCDTSVSSCNNTIGNYTCVCLTGYEKNSLDQCVGKQSRPPCPRQRPRQRLAGQRLRPRPTGPRQRPRLL